MKEGKQVYGGRAWGEGGSAGGRDGREGDK